MITRSRDAADRRVVTIRITADGLAILDELDGPMRRVDDLLGHLGPERLDQLIELLAACRDHAATVPAPVRARPIRLRPT